MSRDKQNIVQILRSYLRVKKMSAIRLLNAQKARAIYLVSASSGFFFMRGAQLLDDGRGDNSDIVNGASAP
jgi:transcriptional regulator GlxA family with amidase domain